MMSDDNVVIFIAGEGQESNTAHVSVVSRTPVNCIRQLLHTLVADGGLIDIFMPDDRRLNPPPNAQITSSDLPKVGRYLRHCYCTNDDCETALPLKRTELTNIPDDDEFNWNVEETGEWQTNNQQSTYDANNSIELQSGLVSIPGTGRQSIEAEVDLAAKDAVDALLSTMSDEEIKAMMQNTKFHDSLDGSTSSSQISFSTTTTTTEGDFIRAASSSLSNMDFDDGNDDDKTTEKNGEVLKKKKYAKTGLVDSFLKNDEFTVMLPYTV